LIIIRSSTEQMYFWHLWSQETRLLVLGLKMTELWVTKFGIHDDHKEPWSGNDCESHTSHRSKLHDLSNFLSTPSESSHYLQ